MPKQSKTVTGDEQVTWSKIELHQFVLNTLEALTKIKQLPCICCTDKTQAQVDKLQEQVKKLQEQVKKLTES